MRELGNIESTHGLDPGLIRAPDWRRDLKRFKGNIFEKMISVASDLLPNPDL
jgi:hypothetical protein